MAATPGDSAPDDWWISLNVTRTRMSLLGFNLSVIAFLIGLFLTVYEQQAFTHYLPAMSSLFLSLALSFLSAGFLLASQELDEEGRSRPWFFSIGDILMYLQIMESLAIAAVEGAQQNPENGLYYCNSNAINAALRLFPEAYPRMIDHLKQLGGGGETCHRCGKAVYPAERRVAAKHVYHPECFCCTTCGKKLGNNEFGVTTDEAGVEAIYCWPHKQQLELKKSSAAHTIGTASAPASEPVVPDALPPSQGGSASIYAA